MDKCHALFRLNRWFLSQCDQDWEHGDGIELRTLDNPGWLLRIDIGGTELEKAKLSEVLEVGDNFLYIKRELHNGKMKIVGSCCAIRLDEMLEKILNWIENRG
ncbi:MAG: Imm53 family immunity protein [Rhizobiaceae bacterium]|nr:Imm53 family immunity protein [Rhizobiaceae bacterium]